MALQLNDPVNTVNRSGVALEGVVVYLGSVKFDSGDDWVGIRLTGSSAGQGKNNGTVKGHAYFNCPPQCGIFVKVSNVTKRTLTRLEALRLKRELATSSSSSGGTASSSSAATSSETPSSTRAASTTPSRGTGGSGIPPSSSRRSLANSTTPASSRTSSTPSTASSVAAESSSATEAAAAPAKPRTKLEEIRRRRLALQERKESEEARPPTETKPPEPVVAAPAPPDPALQKEIDELKQRLTEAVAAAAQELESTKASYESQVTALKEEVAEAQKRVSVSSSYAPSTTDVDDLQRANADLQDQINSSTQEIDLLRQELKRTQENREADQQDALQTKSELSNLKSSLAEQESRNSISTEHYKERAKLQAEISTLKRKIDQMEKENLDLENTIEDLTLDKEQLLEEKEILEDRYEELKIDAETAQIQVDELRMELEDAQQVMATDRPDVDATALNDMDAEDKAQALSLQNSRFRQALIRLREQSSVEKMELQRQLRDAEKDISASKEVVNELEELRQLKIRMDDEINDLKDMVEQGAAFEGMVEDLSDRLLSLEEDYVQLQSTIREMEEASELASEMEEVQAEELKALARDLEGRDTIIRNLEEAIKMQRRREEDMRRTVANYRTTVETLKMEKQTLIDLQEGGEGKRKRLMVSSQKALAKAAQLVADAAAMRKREAKAVMDKIDHQIYRHVSMRLETLLPQASVGGEVAAIKGEMLTAKVINKASQSLSAITVAFGGIIRPPIPAEAKEGEPEPLSLSDTVKADVGTMYHQTEYALDIVDASSGLMRFLAAGQWPDLLSSEASSELGALLGHSMSELDDVLGHVLQSMKEEGALIPEQSNIERLRQATRNTLHHVETDLEREGGSLVPTDWSPPALKLFKDMSLAKFSCMGAAAMLSSVINAEDETEGAVLNDLYNKVEQCGAQASTACLRLAHLDVRNETLVAELEALVSTVCTDSSSLLKSTKETILDGADAAACETAAEAALRSLAKLSTSLRSNNLNANDDNRHHSLSPEADDTWARLASLAKTTRAVDGDIEDVNFLIRARQTEHALASAVENEPKLEIAESKISILEKNLSSRAKEIAMQNARLSELERMLAKSNVAAPRNLSTDFKSSKEFNSLMEENRVLMEAMDVLQRQVDEYENEIRILKDTSKGGRRGAQGGRTPRRGLAVSDLATPSRLGSDDSFSPNLSLEATLFRPALQEALRESWKWKAIATSNALQDLAPLPVPSAQSSLYNDDLVQLNSALANSRLQKASIKLVDLTNKEKSPRAQLQDCRLASIVASQRLENVALRIRGHLTV